MQIVVYYAAFERQEVYEELWPPFLASCHRNGYHVTQLTSRHEKPVFGDAVIRFDIDPSLIVYSREICFAEFLEKHAADDETYFFTEHDSLILSRLPEIPTGIDLVLTTRNYKRGGNVNPGMRFARRSALPFFQAWRDECAKETDLRNGIPKQRWHGDVDALTRVIKHHDYNDGERALFLGVRTMFISAKNFGFDWKHGTGVYSTHFKGEHKLEKLKDAADGHKGSDDRAGAPTGAGG